MSTEFRFNSHTGLVVIDVQKAFNRQNWGKRNNPGAETQIAVLLAGWRDKGLPVFHVRHASAHAAGLFREGKESFEFKPEAKPIDGEPVYKKSVNSSFIGTWLEKDLRARGVDTLVIVGLTTNHCVSTTARMSGNFGFKTFVVEDATATFDRMGMKGEMRPAQEVHAAALSDLSEEFATIVSTNEVLAALAQVAVADAGSKAKAATTPCRPPTLPRPQRRRISIASQGIAGTAAARSAAEYGGCD